MHTSVHMIYHAVNLKNINNMFLHIVKYYYILQLKKFFFNAS